MVAFATIATTNFEPCKHTQNSMTLVVQHFVEISMTAALQNLSSCIMLELVLVLTQLSGASANCFCLTSKHHIIDNLLAIYFVNIGSNNMPLTI